MPSQSNWHELTTEGVAKALRTDPWKGLAKEEAARRFAEHGPNTFDEGAGETLFLVTVRQFKSPLALVLVAAGVVTLVLHEYIDMVVIMVALAINVGMGVVQEERAKSAFEHLKNSEEKFAIVVREGEQRRIEARRLVPGDVVLLSAGAEVPADARLIDATRLSVNESILTGEWVGVSKETKVLPEETRLTDRSNMVWMGTLVTAGTGHAIVVATGEKTEIGEIARSLREGRSPLTPLQKSIRELAIGLVYVIVAALAVLLALGFVRGIGWNELFLIAVAIAVAAVPEGLPAAVTVVLAAGMESILRKRGLVRNLLAAETLGSTTIILTDKTGTLTRAEMRVAGVITPGTLDAPRQALFPGDKEVRKFYADEEEVIVMSIFTGDAFVEGYNDTLGTWTVRGRPVERAILEAGLEGGIRKDELLARNPRIDVIPFESERQLAASLHRGEAGKRFRAYLTGAPEFLLAGASHIYRGGKKMKISDTVRTRLNELLREKADEGMRLIGVGFKDMADGTFSPAVKKESDVLVEESVFVGIILIHDPIRADAAESIAAAKGAGAHVVMVTGDNEHTARRVAYEVGISGPDGEAFTGDELDAMTDEELAKALETIKIFARVLPHQKLRIVEILERRGEIVAMTGDGINDAPALRRANIGIALGSGTDVAKEASDIVLLNNSFTVIVAAIEEGRRILDNVKKVVVYLLSTSFTEIVVVGTALFAGAPLPLLPSQILWTNILEEGFMTFALAFESKERDLMRRDPRNAQMKTILTRRLRALVILLSLVTSAVLAGLFFTLRYLAIPIEETRTVIFALLAVASMLFTLSLKNFTMPFWRIKLFANRYHLFALLATTLLIVLSLSLPSLRTLLSLTALPAWGIGVVIAGGIANLFIVEALKFAFFRNHRMALS